MITIHQLNCSSMGWIGISIFTLFLRRILDLAKLPFFWMTSHEVSKCHGKLASTSSCSPPSKWKKCRARIGDHHPQRNTSNLGVEWKKMVHETQHTQPMTKPKDQPTQYQTILWNGKSIHFHISDISFVESLNLQSNIPQQTSVFPPRNAGSSKLSILSNEVTQQHPRNCSWQASTLWGAII